MKMGLKISVLPCLSDNYGFILVDETTQKVACVDTPDANAIENHLRSLGLNRLDYILNTHWHPDHTGGNSRLKELYGAMIFGPAEVQSVAPVDRILASGDSLDLGASQLSVISLRGHTLGHIGYVDAAGHNAFVGDCLFPLGCGRLFEGTRQDMWESLMRLASLPGDTRLYSAHEYSLANLAFAETLLDSPQFKARAVELTALRSLNAFTVPSILDVELKTNPFLVLPMRDIGFAAQADRFGELRSAKDIFKSA